MSNKKEKGIQVEQFSLTDFIGSIKKDYGLDKQGFKPKKYLQLSKDYQAATNFKGYESSCVHYFVGKADSGKSTAMIELLINCKKQGVIPVFIDLEEKFKWSRAELMGLEITSEEVVDESTGEVINLPKGDFIYCDRSFFIELYHNGDHLKGVSTEDVFNFLIDLFKKQKKAAESGHQVNYAFFIDSYRKLKPRAFLNATIKSGKKDSGGMVASDESKANNMAKVQHNGNQLEYIVEALIKSTNNSSLNFYNWLFIVSHVHDKQTMSIKTVELTGGNVFKYLADTITYLGGKGGDGSRAAYLTYSGKEYRVASEVAVEIDKGHIEQSSSGSSKDFQLLAKGKLYITAHGFLEHSKEALNEYKKQNKEYFRSAGIEDVEFADIKIEDGKPNKNTRS